MSIRTRAEGKGPGRREGSDARVASPTKALEDQEEANCPRATEASVMDTKMKRNMKYSHTRVSMPDRHTRAGVSQSISQGRVLPSPRGASGGVLLWRLLLFAAGVVWCGSCCSHRSSST